MWGLWILYVFVYYARKSVTTFSKSDKSISSRNRVISSIYQAYIPVNEQFWKVWKNHYPIYSAIHLSYNQPLLFELHLTRRKFDIKVTNNFRVWKTQNLNGSLFQFPKCARACWDTPEWKMNAFQRLFTLVISYLYALHSDEYYMHWISISSILTILILLSRPILTISRPIPTTFPCFARPFPTTSRQDPVFTRPIPTTSRQDPVFTRPVLRKTDQWDSICGWPTKITCIRPKFQTKNGHLLSISETW